MGTFNFGRVPLFKFPTGGVNPVTFDNVTGASGFYSPTATFSHTTSGSNRYLVVKIAISGTTRAVSGVTYNGVSMTSLGTASNSNNIAMYGLINPASGANNVVVTFDGSTFSSIGACSYNNVNQTTPTSNFTTATGNSITPSVVVTSATNNMVVDVVSNTIWPYSPGSGQTEEYETSTSGVSGAGSYESGSASVTMSWSMVLPGQWVIAGINILNET